MVSLESLIGLVVSLVLTRLDYCNAVLAGLPAYQLDRLQSAINAAARMICRASQYDHVSLLLKELHWLRVPERIEFKLCALVYKCLNGNGQSSTSDGHPVTSTPAVVFVINVDRASDTLCNTGRPCVSGRRCPGFGTAYQTTSRQHQPTHHSVLR